MLEQFVFVFLKNSGVDERIIQMLQPPKSPPTPEKIYGQFRLPMDYLDTTEKHTLSDTVIADLELAESTQPSGSMYELLVEPPHVFAKQMIMEHKHTFTSNTAYLLETQQTVQNMKHFTHLVGETKTETKEKHSTLPFVFDASNCAEFQEWWKELKEDAYFLEKYAYMEWSIVEHLNTSSAFLQMWSVINILSPIMSLIIPIIFFLFPFILLRMKGIPITFEQYVDTLRDIAKHHFIGKLLNVRAWNVETMLYLGFTGGLYFLQLYQNVHSCMRFYSNIRKMNTILLFMRDYLSLQIKNMSFFQTHNAHLVHYSAFLKETEKQRTVLEKMRNQLEFVSPFTVGLNTATTIGNMLRVLYELRMNTDNDVALRYSIGFEGYLANLRGLYINWRSGALSPATFRDKKYTHIRKQYYPTLKNQFSTIVNDCRLRKNIILSGVNASGKTTYLKTTAINIIITQQFGLGFYGECVLRPYTHIHSYLNIPDTSGRDSLFQAESRRCKEIIDVIQSTKTTNARHFCIFDELYSGTNPEEATKSAYSFLHYLSQHKNVQFILTTHYIGVCRKFKTSKTVANYKMNVVRAPDGKLQYTYRIVKGISNIHGGVEILKTMNYPAEIIANIEKYK